MELIKFLIDEPGKFKLLLFNLLKLLLTLLIANGVAKMYDYNFVDTFIHLDEHLHIGKILLYVSLIIAVWFTLWYLLDALFLFIISVRRTTKVETENERRGVIYSMLRWFGAYSKEENGFLLPGANIHTIIDLVEYVEEDESFDMRNSAFAEILYISIVSWFYLFFNRIHFHLSCGTLLWLSLIPLIGIFFFRSLDSFLITFKSQSSSFSKFFEMIEYRKLIMDIVLQDFSGNVNIEKKTFDLNWGKRKYHLRDFSFYHEGLANEYIANDLKRDRTEDFIDTIAVMNFKPNEEVETLFKAKGIIGTVVAEDEEKLLDCLVSELNRLKLINEN